MKNWAWILILISAVVISSCERQKQSLPASDKPLAKTSEEIYPLAQDVDSKIAAGLDHFQKGSVAEGAGLLLDVILLVKPSGDWPEGFRQTIVAAKEQFLSGDLGNGVKSVSEALSQVQPPPNAESGQKIEVSPSIAETVQNYIMSAREEFKEGNAANGVILILKALELVSPRPE